MECRKTQPPIEIDTALLENSMVLDIKVLKNPTLSGPGFPLLRIYLKEVIRMWQRFSYNDVYFCAIQNIEKLETT